MTRVPRQSYLPLILTAGLFLLIYLVGTQIPEETVRETVDQAGPLGPLILTLLIWATNFFAPLGGTPFLFAGFYLYGPRVILLATVAAFIASITNFWVARTWGIKVVTKFAGAESLEKIDRLTKNYGLQALIIGRVFFGPFHDVISYAFGLTPIKFKTYLIVSTLGIVPGTILWYFLATKIGNALNFTAMTVGLAYLTLSLYLAYRKITKRK